jgi:transporter family protein
MTWLVYAAISACAAALTAILAKIGVEGVPSTLATAVRTVVVGVALMTAGALLTLTLGRPIQ